MWRLGEKAQPESISLQRREKNANIEGLIPSYGSCSIIFISFFVILRFFFFPFYILHVTY